MKIGGRMNKRFSGKLVLVPGGTGGLGRAVTVAFLEEGAKVVVTYRNQKEWEDLKEIGDSNMSSLAGHPVDVTDESEVEQFVQKIVAEYGHLDVMVNTVGAYAGGTKLWETDPKVFDQMLSLNLRSGFVLLRAVVPAMLKQKRGAIINISSRAAVDHAAGGAAYAAAKAAAVAM